MSEMCREQTRPRKPGKYDYCVTFTSPAKGDAVQTKIFVADNLKDLQFDIQTGRRSIKVLTVSRMGKHNYFNLRGKTMNEIFTLEQRREAAVYQRKITTSLATAVEYDNEIAAIDRRLELLRYKLKPEEVE
jgi:hypothetical protein